MDMIKKIAVTASTMLFVLTQIFSFYVIYTGQKEKIELLNQNECRLLENKIREFEHQQNEFYDKAVLPEYIIVYCFRQNMPENFALYKDERELYNNSPYDFAADQIFIPKENEGMTESREIKVNGSRLLLYYKTVNIREEKYLVFHVQDITYVYETARRFVFQEILISILMSVCMAKLLVVLIHRITRPLQMVNETQRQLIGSMSHELKTPLTAIRGYSETLLNVNLNQHQQEKALQYIYTESGRMSRLTEKMMELTRLYEPECSISFRQVSIEELFTAVENSVAHGLKEKELTLIREGDFLGRSLALDSDLMASFFINLINNSVMASNPGGRIYLGGDDKSLWVRDEGCGIPPEEVDKVRKAFYRVDKSRSRKSGNMGLGLALCDQIATVHHGRMEIESQVGKGTRISFCYGR